MCGVCGFVETKVRTREERVRTLMGMNARLRHRGPDGSGMWFADEHGVGLGHTRLKIIDLSEAGHQPMVSSSERFVISYNGEVYNHGELRSALGSRSWRGHSDTEVLLEVIERWGIEPAVQRLDGMFAFALWDRRERQLHLVRDRAGIKPMYYGRVNGSFVFGSELGCLHAYPDFQRRVSRAAVAAFLRTGNVPSPLSIYEGIRKLPPGHLLSLSVRDGAERVARYWRYPRSAAKDPGTPDDQLDRVESELVRAVGMQTYADVPVGVFLSGGVDSSVVAALAQSQRSEPIRTFSVRFEEIAYDESDKSQTVAKALGSEHTQLVMTSQRMIETIPKLADLQDEPLAHASQVPLYLLAREARDHITVALTGDGGDEAFAGYTRHVWAPRIARALGSLPPLASRLAQGLGEQLAGVGGTRAFAAANQLLPSKYQQRLPRVKLEKLVKVLQSRSLIEIYRGLTSHWDDVPLVDPPRESEWSEASDADQRAAADHLLAYDFEEYLPSVLTKVDRATMGVGLEARPPLLDHRLLELAASLPLSTHLRDGRGKWCLRKIAERHLPRGLLEKPKMGFVVPVGDWVRGPLRDWAEDLLSPASLAESGVLETPVREAWSVHLSGARDVQQRIWTLLTYQAWVRSACSATPSC